MPPPPIHVKVLSPPGSEAEHSFAAPFRIGRTVECEVCIKNEFVSRVHADVVLLQDQWCLRDLNSSNGIFVAGQRVESLNLTGKVAVRLGIAGPELCLVVEEPQSQQPQEKRQRTRCAIHLTLLSIGLRRRYCR